MLRIPFFIWFSFGDIPWYFQMVVLLWPTSWKPIIFSLQSPAYPVEILFECRGVFSSLSTHSWAQCFLLVLFDITTAASKSCKRSSSNGSTSSSSVSQQITSTKANINLTEKQIPSTRSGTFLTQNTVTSSDERAAPHILHACISTQHSEKIKKEIHTHTHKNVSVPSESL